MRNLRETYREYELHTLKMPKKEKLHRRHVEFQHIGDYVSEYGLTIADLRTGELGMYLAARNLEELVLNLKNAALCEPDLRNEDEDLAEKELKDDAVHEKEKPFIMPTDNFEVAPVDSLSQFSSLLPVEYVLPDDLIALNFFRGRLRRRQYLETDAERKQFEDSYGEVESQNKRVLRASVLLDISESMNNYDRRNLLARGLSLVFLKHAHNKCARIHLLPFQYDINRQYELPKDVPLHELVSRVTSIQNASTTNIQRALSSFEEVLSEEGAYRFDDCLLISDGLSELHTQPDKKVRLHTFLVGDISVRDLHDEKSRLVFNERSALLRDWSENFYSLNTPEEYLLLDERDVDYVNTRLIEIEAEIGTDTGVQEKLYRELENIAYILDNFTCNSEDADISRKALLYCESIQGAFRASRHKQNSSEAAADIAGEREEISASTHSQGEHHDDFDPSLGKSWGAAHMSKVVNPLKMLLGLCRYVLNRIKQVFKK